MWDNREKIKGGIKNKKTLRLCPRLCLPSHYYFYFLFSFLIFGLSPSATPHQTLIFVCLFVFQIFFVLFLRYLVYPPLLPLITHLYIFVCLSFRYFLFCFPDIWFIPLCHPSSPPLSGYDAHPCRDRPKSTEAIYYTLCKMCTHVFILTYITNIHRSAWAKKVESTHVDSFINYANYFFALD